MQEGKECLALGSVQWGGMLHTLHTFLYSVGGMQNGEVFLLLGSVYWGGMFYTPHAFLYSVVVRCKSGRYA